MPTTTDDGKSRGETYRWREGRSKQVNSPCDVEHRRSTIVPALRQRREQTIDTPPGVADQERSRRRFRPNPPPDHHSVLRTRSRVAGGGCCVMILLRLLPCSRHWRLVPCALPPATWCCDACPHTRTSRVPPGPSSSSRLHLCRAHRREWSENHISVARAASSCR